MKANSNNQEIFMLIDNLLNELLQYDKTKHNSIIENYSKDPAFKFLLEEKWRNLIERRIDMYLNKFEDNINIEKKKSRFDVMIPTVDITKNNPQFQTDSMVINPENLPAGIIATMTKSKFKKNKEENLAYFPYQMLEIESIPDIYMNELPNAKALGKLEEFYKYYKSSI